MVDLAEQLKGASLLIKCFQRIGIVAEVRCPGVKSTQCLPVIGRPAGIADPRLIDSLQILPFHFHRDRQPLETARAFHFIAIPPVAPGILHIIIQHENVDAVDQVEVALPGNVIGLKDRDLFHDHNMRALAMLAALIGFVIDGSMSVHYHRNIVS